MDGTYEFRFANEVVVVDFTDGTIIKNGMKEHLEKLENRTLYYLVLQYPLSCSGTYLAENVFDDDRDGDDPFVIKHIARILSNVRTKLGIRIEDKELRKAISRERGYYRIDPARISITRTDSSLSDKEISCLETLGADSLFPERDAKDPYYVPEETLNELLSDAFLHNSRVHVISGEPGIGKTDLARIFAKQCSERKGNIAFAKTIFTKYDVSLENTITSLQTKGFKDGLPTFETILELLKKAEKPCLLIIDNYDSDTEELTEDNLFYQQLIQSGCHLLLTSRKDLRFCYQVRQTDFKPLSTETLMHLFLDLCNNISENESRSLPDLIVKYLKNNTYLVRLCASLCETKSVQDIISAFEVLNVNRLDDPIMVKDHTITTLYEAYKCLFHISELQDDISACLLLKNMAMLPLTGMPYEEFFTAAFSDSNSEYKKVYKYLQKKHWVCLENRRVLLHPLIREMMINELPYQFSDIRNYVVSLNRKSAAVHMYENGFYELLSQNRSLYKAIEKTGLLQISEREIVLLIANITSLLDIVRDNTLSVFVQQAYSALEGFDSSNISPEEQFLIARSLDVVGYSLLHVRGKEKMLLRSEKEIVSLKETGYQPEEELVELSTLNQGNIAALSGRKGDYQKMLEIHDENRKKRQELLKESPSKKLVGLVASSYKGMATACYYLAGNAEDLEEKKNYLLKSYDLWSEAIHYYTEAYYPEPYHLDIAVCDTRRIGTVNALWYSVNDEEKKKYADCLCKRIMSQLVYLDNMSVKNEQELQNAVEVVSKFIQQIKDTFAQNKALMKTVDEIQTRIN